jgi:hypothetical protein
MLLRRLAELRPGTILLFAAAWMVLIVALPRIVVAMFYLAQWWRARADPSVTDAAFFARVHWRSWQAHVAAFVVPPIALVFARWIAQRLIAGAT